MTVEELIAKLRLMPKRAELLALEPGCEKYCEREIDEVEATAHRVYLHLDLHRDERRTQGAPSLGTWNVGVFGNDAAADLLGALEDAAPAEALDLLRAALAVAAGYDGYLEVDDGQAAVAAAAVVAAQRLVGSRLDVTTVPPWVVEGGLDIPQEFDGPTLAALDRVVREPSKAARALGGR